VNEKDHLEDLDVDVNNKMDLKEKRWKGVYWINLAP
jgi:hypothetical protein